MTGIAWVGAFGLTTRDCGATLPGWMWAAVAGALGLALTIGAIAFVYRERNGWK